MSSSDCVRGERQKKNAKSQVCRETNPGTRDGVSGADDRECGLWGTSDGAETDLSFLHS
jgi:hypothetical protein